MEQPIKWSSDIQVNTVAAGDQKYSRVTPLEGGGFVVTWIGPNSLNENTSHVRIFDAYGNELGPEFEVDAVYAEGVDVVALPAGGFAVATTEWVSGERFVSIAIFDGAGNKLLADFSGFDHMDPDHPGNVLTSAMTALADGTFVIVALVQEDDGSGPYQNAVVQRIDAQGNKLGPTEIVGQDLENSIETIEVADISSGRFAVVWSGGETNDRNLGMQRYEYDGDKVGGIVPIVAEPGNQLRSQVAADGSGNFLISYIDYPTNEAYTGLLVSNDGVPVGTPFGISDAAAHGNQPMSPEIIGLRAGGYFAAWIEIVAGNYVVVGQLLDGAGSKVGGEFLIKPPIFGTPVSEVPALAELADGRIVVTWNDNYQDSDDKSGHAVFAQIIDPRDGEAHGTEAGETMVGSSFSLGIADFMDGHGGNDLLNGYDGNDTLYGSVGNDTLNGDVDNDSMIGGSGDDTYYVDSALDVVIEDIDEGNDTVIAAVSWTLAAGQEVELLELNEDAGDSDLTGNEFGQHLKGNSHFNKLYGLGGNDTLEGGGDQDSLEGGEGDDLYIIDMPGDRIVEVASGGNDTIEVGFDYQLDDADLAEIENIVLAGNDSADATGNSRNNKLTGNSNDNHLFGLGGNDTLDGGAGADTMEGGAGNDLYYVDIANDVVTELADAGTDTVHSSVNHALGANVENLVLTGGAAIGKGNGANNSLRGNGLDNTLRGGSGNDSLDGGLGVDSLEGGSGNDTYVLGTSKDHVKDTSGADDKMTTTISRSLGSYTGIENLTLGGIGDINGRGSGVANDLLGNAGENKLWGLAGDDLLRGGAGADQLWGGKDKDVFDFNSASEIGKSTGNRDIVKDFKHLSDRIDLKSIDANTTASGNNAFAFLAAEGSKFSGVAGQLTWDQVNKAGSSNDVTLVRGDLNGDKVADFVLELSGLVTLTKADFIL
jgi:Ca2+-binding RTX toxin-like protein